MISLPIQSIDSASQELQQRVTLHLQNRQLAFGGRLRIEAKHGTITLAGRVRTFCQRQLIYAATRKVSGVMKVIDQLEVETEPETGSHGGKQGGKQGSVIDHGLQPRLITARLEDC